MAKLIKQIIKRKSSQQQPATQIMCNFADNYYGDQVCRPVQTNTAQRG